MADDPWGAYCLDAVVVRFGTALEQAIEASSNGIKNESLAIGARMNTIARWLGVESQHRDPAKES
jgi:hypothetical protein